MVNEAKIEAILKAEKDEDVKKECLKIYAVILTSGMLSDKNYLTVAKGAKLFAKVLEEGIQREEGTPKPHQRVM